MINTKKGFTLIELLISISIIGILVTIAAFGLQGSREAARDAKRKTDLQTIKSALELRYADCADYPTPASGNSIPTNITGDGSPTQCAVANVYLSNSPTDPQTARRYYYTRPTATSYILCTSLETAPNPAVDTSGCGSCGTGVTCNFKVSGP